MMEGEITVTRMMQIRAMKSFYVFVAFDQGQHSGREHVLSHSDTILIGEVKISDRRYE